MKTTSVLSTDSHLSVLASQPLVHFALLALAFGVGLAIYLARRGKS